MEENIVTKIHSLLMDTVDGPAADRFLQHVSSNIGIGDASDINQYYTEADQLLWISTYFLQQLSVFRGDHPIGEYNLLACRNCDDFIAVFRATVLPYFANSENALPNINLPIINMGNYHARE